MSETLSRTILIVEDDPVWQSRLTALLRREDFKVINAFDYGDTLNQLQRLIPLPELAIVDLELQSSIPQQSYDGLQVLTALRQKAIYAIILSAYIRDIADDIPKRPEVYHVVDKLRFVDESFEKFFITKVNEAVLQAQVARWAEGRLFDQQQRLRNLPLRLPTDQR
jgi:CheY-like chemotaxis protein